MADQAAPPFPIPATQPLLVGREREQAVLRDALAAALAGRGSVVLIGGEAGIGKTALAEATLADAAGQGAAVLVGRCYDLGETPPYGPWAEALARAPRADLPALPAAVLPPEHEGEPSSGQDAVVRRVLAYFAALAARQLLVLLLDDLQWADPASLDLLRALGRQLADRPILILTTYRDDEIGPNHPLYALVPLLVREARACRLDLRPLDDAAVRALVGSRYRLPPDDAARLVPYLVARAEGNPFFLSELLRALEETGILRATGGGWMLAPLEQLPVPRLLRQVIDGRLARLGIATREALGAAAVIGQVVPFSLWALLTSRDQTGLLDLAAQARAARLLEETVDGVGVRFVHALVREAVYEGVRPTHRRALHRRASEALLATPNPDPDAVASHLVRGADPRAAEWLRRAGDRAHRAYAWLTAAARYEAALALVEQGGSDPLERAWLLFRLARLRRFADASGALPRMEEAVHLADQSGDRFLAAHARLGAGHLRCLAGDYRQGIPEMEAGLMAVETLSAAERAPQTRLDPTDRSTGWGTLIYFLAVLGRYAEARTLKGSHPASAPEPGTRWRLDAAPHADAQAGLGMVYAAIGRPEEARHMFARARTALRAVDHAFMAGWCAALEMSWVAMPYRAERFDERRALAADGAPLGLLALIAWPDHLPPLWHLPLLVAEGRWHEVASTAAAPDFLPLVRVWQSAILAWVARERGQTSLAWQFVRRWLPDGPATEPGGVEFLEALHFQRLAAALAVDGGDLPTARAWLEAHGRWLAWNGAVLGRAEGQLGWAAYHRAAGHPDRARACADQALAHASDPRQPLALLAAHRLLGEIATADGLYAEATGHVDAAFALARACALPYERALCLLALAELHAAEARCEQATRALAEAHAVFADLGTAPALARANALAGRLAISAAAPTRRGEAPVATPAGLSRREAEVLRLLATGRSNQQIAGDLILSPRTVQRHVANAYLKIGTHNRAGATAYVLRHQLI